MKYALKYDLRTADRVVASITWLGISKHHCLYLGLDHWGIEWIAENYKFKSVRLMQAKDYFKTISKIARIQRFTATQEQSGGQFRKRWILWDAVTA